MNSSSALLGANYSRQLIGISAILAIAIVITICFTHSHISYRLNWSASAPLGLWRIAEMEQSATIGEQVFVCLPEGKGRQIAKMRGYLSWGLCPGGVTPLIKTISAREDTRVTTTQTIALNGLTIPATSIFQSDARGRPMPIYEGGTIPQSHVFLFSDEVTSYDSRYFGPIHQKHILGLAVPVLVF